MITVADVLNCVQEKAPVYMKERLDQVIREEQNG